MTPPDRPAPSPAPRPGSVTGRLLRGLLGPLIALALVLGFGGALLINRMVERVHDRLLEASARAIADTLAVDGGRVTLNLPPAAFGMLENPARDNVYYSVSGAMGLVTGYADLPPAPKADAERTLYRYADYRGRRIRIAVESRRLPRVDGLVVVQVAETLDARHALAWRLLLALGALEISIIAMTALLVPAAVGWGLRPLRRIQEAADAHRADDAFAALPVDEAPAELRSLIGAFNALLRRLKATTDGVRRFSADASHQLRTPVAVMRTNIGLLDSLVGPSGEARERLTDLDAGAERLQRLIEQLLALARAEAAGATRLQQVDLAPLVQQIAMDHAPFALRAAQDIDFEGGASHPKAWADPLFVSEIVRNLLENAVCYAGSGATITIRIELMDDEVRLVIADDGAGASAADLHRLTEPFYRAGRERDSVGSGLGLSIVQRLANAMGGRFEVQPAEAGLRTVTVFRMVRDHQQ